VNIWRICATVIAGVFPPDAPSFQAQEPQRHQSQRHVVMPPDPTANFIMIQPGLAITGLEELFNTVSLTLDSNQFGQGHFRASVSDGVVDLCLADGADHNQSFFRPDFPVLLGTDPDGHRIDVEWPFLPTTHSQPYPLGIRLALGPRVSPLPGDLTFASAPSSATSRTSSFQITYCRVARHIQNVALAVTSQDGSELGDTTEFVVAGDPTVRQPKQAAVEQIEGDLPFLLESDLGRDMTFQASRRGRGPFPGQIESPVQRCVTLGRHPVASERERHPCRNDNRSSSIFGHEKERTPLCL